MESLRTYQREIAKHPLLTVEQERDLAHKVRAGDKRAADALVTANLRLVIKVAYENKSYGIPLEDLVQEGNIGLMRAVPKFDPDRGCRFTTYAVNWVRSFIYNYILKNWSLVKTGTTNDQRKLFFTLARTRRELSAASGTDVTDGAIAAKLGVSVKSVTEMTQRLGCRDLSVDAPVNNDGTETTYLERMASGEDLEAAIGVEEESQDAAVRVQDALKTLNERERFIADNRLMRDTDEALSLDDIGKHFGFSRERARQIELVTRIKIRVALKDDRRHKEYPVKPNETPCPAINTWDKVCAKPMRRNNTRGICTACWNHPATRRKNEALLSTSAKALVVDPKPEAPAAKKPPAARDILGSLQKPLLYRALKFEAKAAALEKRMTVLQTEHDEIMSEMHQQATAIREGAAKLRSVLA